MRGGSYDGKQDVMPIATTSPRYQIVIPKAIRRRIGLKPGQKVSVELETDGAIRLVPFPDDLVKALTGCCKHLGGGMTRALRAERRREHV